MDAFSTLNMLNNILNLTAARRQSRKKKRPDHLGPYLIVSFKYLVYYLLLLLLPSSAYASTQQSLEHNLNGR